MAKKEKAGAGKTGQPGPKGGKHEAVTSASLDRRAKAHLRAAVIHEGTVHGGNVTERDQIFHQAVGQMHRETATILMEEAEEIRSHHR